MKVENIYLNEEGKVEDYLRLNLKTPKKFHKELPEKYHEAIGLTICGAKEMRPMLFFLKKCMEDGFRESGASALIDFCPHLTK